MSYKKLVLLAIAILFTYAAAAKDVGACQSGPSGCPTRCAALCGVGSFICTGACNQTCLCS